MSGLGLLRLGDASRLNSPVPSALQGLVNRQNSAESLGTILGPHPVGGVAFYGGPGMDEVRRPTGQALGFPEA